MASPSTQDPTAPPSEALFDRRPSSDLGDTVPFSLLNALLEGEPDAPRYDPPALKRKVRPLPPKAKRIIEGKKLEAVLETMPVVAEQPKPKPKPSPEAEPTPKAKAAPEPLEERKTEKVAPLPAKVSPSPSPAEIEEKATPKPAPVEAKEQPAVSQKPVPKAPETPAAAPPPKNQLSPTEAKKAPPLEPKPLVEAEESKAPPPPARFPEIRGSVITPPPPPRPKRRAKPTPLEPPSDLQSQSLSQEPAAKPETSPPSTTPKPLLSEHESRLQKRHGRIIQHRVSKSFDPINKAIRIFESLEVRPPAPPEPKVEETPVAPEPESKAEIATPAPLAAPPAVETFAPEAPAPEPPTNKPTPPAPPTPAPEVPAAPPVRVSRRRRRRAPVNPWTAKSVFPKEDSPASRQQHIDDALASLAKILEGTLDTPAPPESASAGTVAAASDEPVVLNHSFGKTQRQGQSKVKLLPRELPESRTPPVNPEVEVLSLEDLEITAPTDIVAKDAPISPFTKVVPDPTEPTPGAAPQPSPFRIATPTDKPAVVDTEKASTFASPFSTALKKRQSAPAAPVSQGNPGPTILPIKPPADPEAEAAIAAGNLPAPTYSFSTMGLPSAQHPGPVQTPIGAPPAGPPNFQAPADAHPDRIASPDPPTSTVTAAPAPAAVAEAPELLEPEVRTKRKRRPKPEPGSWGFLTWILAFVCVTFLIIYIHEIQQTLQRNSAKPFSPLIPTDAADPAVPLEPAGLADLNDATLLEPELAPTESRLPLQPNVDLTEPLECLNQFLNAETSAVRQRYVVEPDDLGRIMETHYQRFPLQANTTRRIVGSGTFADSGREHFTVTLGWEDDTETDVRMIKDSVGNHRFSWHAFEQSRSRLLRKYTETSWTGWTHFFVQIKPALAEALPEDTILDHLWFRITVPEDPEFEALAYVDENSSMLKDFKERFPNQSNYEVIAELLRGDSNLPGDDRPVFRIARLINDSWDPSPNGGQ